MEWLNVESPPTLAELRGQTVLLDFWDFTCINCLRTLPYLRDWNERYRGAGLAIVGIHTPEFRFARSRRHVQAALGRLGILWPVALDNQQAAWTAHAIRAWPTLALIDPEGYVRNRHTGESGYPQAEEAIRSLILEGRGPRKNLPDPAGAVRPQDAPGTVCLPSTPELQADSIGNRPSPSRDPATFQLPEERSDGHYYLEGDWRLEGDGLIAEKEGSAVVLPFHAATVHAVLSPDSDPAAATGDPSRIEASLDGRPVPAERFGRDLAIRLGSTCLFVDQPRAYEIVRDLAPGPHEVRLSFLHPGSTIYAFSFGSCFSPAPLPRSPAC